MYALPRAILPIAVLLLAACGGGGSSSSEPGALSAPTQAEIGPAGGTLEVPISTGVMAELEFPAGALRETVSLTFTPEAPETGARMRLRIEPGDLELAGPVSLRLTGTSPSQPGSAAFYVGSLDDRMVVPTTTDPASVALTAQTRLLLLEAAPALEARAARSQRLQTGGTGQAGFINVAQMDCLNLLPELTAQIFRARQSEFTAHRVYQLTQTYRMVESMCAGSDDAAVEAQLELQMQEIRQTACEAMVRTVDAIVLFVAPTEEEFYERSNRLLGAQAAVELVGGSCNAPMSTMDAYAKAMSDYIEAFRNRVNSMGFGGPVWLARRAELKQIVRLYEVAGMLEMGREQQAILDTVFKPALAKLHERAFETCRRDNPAEQGRLADLKSGGQVYGDAIAFLALDEDGIALIPTGIAQDIQYCASRLSIRAYDGAEPLPGPALQLGGGDAPGAQLAQGTIQVPLAEGVLSLDGVVRPLLCASPNAAAAYDPSTLVIRFNGVTVSELSPAAANFLPGMPLELDMQALYAAAGLDADAPGTYALEIFREGTSCGGMYGEDSFKLFEVTVKSDEAAAAPSISVVSSSTMADLAGRGGGGCSGGATRTFTSSPFSRHERGDMDLSGPQGAGRTNCEASVPGITARLTAQRRLSGPQLSTTPVTALPASFSGGAEVSERLQLEIANPATGWRQSAGASAHVEVHGAWEFQASGAPVAYTVSVSVSPDAGVYMSASITSSGQEGLYLDVCARPSPSAPTSTFQAYICNDSDPVAAVASRTISGVLQPGQWLRISGSGLVKWGGDMHYTDFGASGDGESGSFESGGAMSFQVTFSVPQ